MFDEPEDIFASTDAAPKQPKPQGAPQDEAPGVPSNLPMGNARAAAEKPSKPAPAPGQEVNPSEPAKETGPSVALPKQPPKSPPSEAPKNDRGSKKNTALFVVLGIVGLVIILGIIFFVTVYSNRTEDVSSENEQNFFNTLDEEDKAIEDDDHDHEDDDHDHDHDGDELPLEEDIDSDGDGLTDTEEEEAGTDPAFADTDEDGLGDRDEVVIYGTDPLNPDTDGDGFEDGTEVGNGYNPNGTGRLFEVPTLN